MTGGAGYGGAALVDELIGAGRQVRVLDSLLHGQRDVAERLVRQGAEVRIGDVWADRDLEVFGEQFWRPYVHVRDAARTVRADRGRVSFVHRDEDPRDYKVAFGKVRDVLGFEPSMRVPDGVREVAGALDEGLFADPWAARHRNIP